MQKVSLALSILALLLVGVNHFTDSHDLSLQKPQIEKIIRDYLVEKPEVLVEASQVLQQKQQKAQMEQAQAAIAANRSALLAHDSPVLGNKEGEIVLIKFLDYQCSHCKRMEPVVADLIAENPSLKVIIMELPIFGGSSLFAAKAALAAGKQGKFAPLHKAMLAADGKLSDERILELAHAEGIDIAQLQKELQNPAIELQLQENARLASQMHIRGTPYFIIMRNSENAEGQAFIFPGGAPKEQLQLLIDQVSQ